MFLALVPETTGDQLQSTLSPRQLPASPFPRILSVSDAPPKGTINTVGVRFETSRGYKDVFVELV